MNILVYFSVLDRFLSQVAYQLQASESDVELSGIVNATHQAETVKRGRAQWTSLDVFSIYRRAYQQQHADMEFLRGIEAEYGIPNLGLIVAADRYVKNYDIGKQRLMLETVFRFLLGIIEKRRPEVILSEGIDCIISYSLYAIARRKGIPFIVPGYARIPGRTSFIWNNNCDRWARTEDLFRQMLSSGLDDAGRRVATTFLADFRNRRPMPPSSASPARIRFRTLKELFDAARTYFRDPQDYNMLPPWVHVRNRLTRLGRSYFSGSSFEAPVSGEQYVYFPLHQQPESTTSVLGPYSVDQCALVENVAKSLPIGVVLYVKEHPVSVGRRPVSYYRRLRKMPGVRLISPTVSSHALILGAAAVLTISGTAGWEAVLYEKPVITLGRAFYNMSGLTYEVHSLWSLPEIIHNAIFRWKPDPERLLSFVAAALGGTYEGEMVYPHVRFLDETEHAQKIGAALRTELRTLDRIDSVSQAT